MIDPRMIATVMELADRINAACNARNVSHALRQRAHSLHGELIARGADSPDEVLRVVEAMLDREAQQEMPA